MDGWMDGWMEEDWFLGLVPQSISDINVFFGGVMCTPQNRRHYNSNTRKQRKLQPILASFKQPCHCYTGTAFRSYMAPQSHFDVKRVNLHLLSMV